MPNQVIQVADTALPSRRFKRVNLIVLGVAVAVGASLSVLHHEWLCRTGFFVCDGVNFASLSGILGSVAVFFVVGLLREAWDLVRSRK